MVVHHDGAHASACAPTGSLAYYVRPSGGGSLVRDVRSWRSFVSYHVRPVRHEIDGIAAQAVAVSHALASGVMRDGAGLLSASAAEVSASVRALQARRRLWEAPPGPIALLDPISGLAIRFAHVRLDGTLALDEVPTGALGDDVPSPAPEAHAPSAPSPACDSEAADARLPRPNRRAPEDASFGSWVRRLPDDVSIRFAPNRKSGKSAARYSLYSPATSVGEYRRLNPAPQFVLADLKNDLEKGLAQLPPALWAQRVGGEPILRAAAAAAPPVAVHESVHAFGLRVRFRRRQ